MLRVVEWGVKRVSCLECRVWWSVECGVWSVVCGVKNEECEACKVLSVGSGVCRG